jgi:hypothetical protein
MFVAGASLAAPTVGDLVPVSRSERPAPSDDWSMRQLERSVECEVDAGEVQIAGKKRRGGGKRGGAKSKNRGGFKAGNERQALRAGEPGRPGRPGDPGGPRGDVRRDVDIDRDVHVHGHGDWDDDDDELKAAIVGGVVGMGVGALISDSEE